MIRPVSPPTLAAPAAAYSLAVVVDQPTRWLHTSGIVPTRPDGTIADTIGEQAEEVWRSIGALLAEAGLGVADIVSYTTYAVQGQPLADVMAARDRALQGHLACSTLIVVPQLARPEWLLEIQVVAAGTV